MRFWRPNQNDKSNIRIYIRYGKLIVVAYITPGIEVDEVG
jgi:hypothetical protein